MKKYLIVLIMLMASCQLYAQIIQTVAGRINYSGDGGLAILASLNNPYAMTIDVSGNIFIATISDNRIRKIDAITNQISTYAGTGVQGYSGDGGAAINASFNFSNLVGLTTDNKGNLYIGDCANNSIRKITASTGIVTSIAGNGTYGYSGDGGPATAAAISGPDGIAVDSSGNLFIYDRFNYVIRKIDANTRKITTIAGNGTNGYSGDGGLAINASLSFGERIALDKSGNLFFADEGNNVVREINANTHIITTVAGTGNGGYSGDGSLATAANLNGVMGLALDANNNIYLSDQVDGVIRRIDAGTHIITSIAGTGTVGFSGDGGLATGAQLNYPTDIAFDKNNSIYICDNSNKKIRKIDSVTKIITSISGNGYIGTVDGIPAIQSNLNSPFGVYTDASGNFYIVDYNKIRKVNKATGIITTIAGTGINGYNGDNIPATSAQISIWQGGICFDHQGNLYFADMGNGRIRKINAVTGIITTIAGGGTSTADGVPATTAVVGSPRGVAVDAHDNIYEVGSSSGRKLRKIDAVTGLITTLAGTAAAGYNGDGILAINAQLNTPENVALDANGNIYIADMSNNRVRKITASTGIISTVAGNGTAGFSGDGGLATAAEINNTWSIAVDKKGNLFLADANNNRIRRVDATTGIITTIAGNGVAGYSGDGGNPLLASMNGPTGIAVDTISNVLYIADDNNNLIRELTFATGPSIKLFSPVSGYAGITDTIRGKGFTGTSAVSFGGVAAASFRVINDSTIIAITGNGSTGNVLVTTPTGTANLGVFTFCINQLSTITITANTGTAHCAGSPVIFTAIPVNAAFITSCQWYKNNIALNIYSLTYTDYFLSNNDSVWCILTMSSPCQMNNRVKSNVLKFIVNQNLMPSVSISTGTYGLTANGFKMTFTAVSTNTGSNVQFQWKKNNVNVGGNNNSYTDSLLKNGDSVYCVLTVAGSCFTSDSVRSNVYTVQLSSVKTSVLTGSITSCSGTASTQLEQFSITGTNLTGNLSIGAPVGFEISLTSTGVFGNSLLLTPQNHTVGTTTIFVRASVAALPGNITGNVSISAAGSTTQTVVVNATVNLSPMINTGTIASVNTTATSFSIPYTALSGSPNQYSISAGANAINGFTAVSKALLGSSPITVNIPASPANTYNFNLIVNNSTTGCASSPIALNVLVTNPQSSIINSINPVSGPVGTLVTISGSNLNNATAIIIGGIAAIPISNTGTSLVAMVMPGAVTGTVSVTISGGKVSGPNFAVIRTKYPSVQQGGKLVGSGTVGQSLQGISVAISADGNTAIVGGPFDNSNLGAAWVYIRSGNTWIQQGNKLVGTGSIGKSYQGWSVSISADGNTAIIGGYADNYYQGAAWIFTRKGNTWIQQGNKLVGNGAGGGAAQGSAVSISADGNTAIVGGFMDNSSVGAAWIFTRSGNIWLQQGNKLTGSGTIGAAQQGNSVCISADGNTAIVGGPFDNSNFGAAWIFIRSGNNWTQQGNKLTGIGNIGNAEQGYSVSISADGNTAILGGFTDNSSLGAAWVFIRNGNTWIQQGNKLLSSASSGVGGQGFSVSISADGNTAITGGIWDNSGLGALSVFNRNGNIWAQQGINLMGTGSIGSNVQQGNSVCISADGNTAIVGGAGDNNAQGAAWVFIAGNVIPVITTIGNLTSFATCAGTNSTSQNFTVSGNNLSSNLILTAPTGYELSNNSTGKYAATDTLIPVTGIVVSTTVYVRLSSIASGTPAGNISISSTGASTQTVAVSGSVNPLPVVVVTNNRPLSFCTGDSTILSSSMQTGIQWQLNNVNINGTAGNMNNLTIQQSGVYKVIITNSRGCSASSVNDTVTVNALPQVPVVTSRNKSSFCQGGIDTLVSSSATGNQWLVSGTALKSANGNMYITGNAGSYTVSVTNANGCTAVSAPMVLTVNALPTITIGSIGGINTTATSFSLPYTATTGNPNQYSITTGTTVLSGFTPVNNAVLGNSPINVNIPASAANTYNFNLTVANSTTGCVSAPVPFNVAVTTPITNTVINSINPVSGPVGTLVTITGTNLANPTAINIGGVSAIPISNTGTSIVAMVMPGASTGVVSVTTVNGSANGTNFTVIPTKYPSVQQGGKLVGTGAVGYAQQGFSIAISADGNTAIVGGSWDNNSIGASWIYIRSNGVWSQQGSKLVGSGAIGYAAQGSSVSISADGNTAIVGGYFDNYGEGAAWIFTRTNGIWTQQGNKLVGNKEGTLSTGQQGSSVSISADGNTAIVGGPWDNNNTGAAWIYTRNNGVWTQQSGKLVGTGAVGGGSQGNSVAISADGNTAIVGGWFDNYINGAAWIYTRSKGVWTQQGAKLVGTGGNGGTWQGSSVAISADGNTAIVGGVYDNNQQGAVWIFNRYNGIWTQQGSKLVGSGAIGQSWQGYSVSISADGNTAIVGGYKDNNSQGAVWVYNRINGIWKQQGNKLVGTGSPYLWSEQGYSVALSADGNTAIFGGNADNGDIGAAWVYIVGNTVISVSGSLNAFTNCSGTVSTPQSITVSGNNLSSNIIITAPAGYELSNSASGKFATTDTLVQVSGIVTSTNVYVRLSSAASGTPSGNLSISSTGATTQTIAVSGTVNPLPAAAIVTNSRPLTFCNGDSTVLTSSVTTGIQWQLNNVNITGATGSKFTAKQSGIFKVLVTNSNGCSNVSAGDTVINNPIPVAPVITSGGSTSICIGNYVVFNSNTASGNQWYLNGTAIGGAKGASDTARAAGNYTVITTNNNGCSSPASSAITVTVNPLPAIPTITSKGSTSFCQGLYDILSSSSTTGNQWKLNGTAIAKASTSQSFVANVAGNYTVTVSNAAGCTATSATTAINIIPLPAKPVITEDANMNLVSSAATGNQWYSVPEELIGDTGHIYTPWVNGNYTVQVTQGGCASQMSDVFMYNNPSLNKESNLITGTSTLDSKSVQLYPNPVGNTLKISYQLSGIKDVTVEIVDINGNIIARKESVTSGSSLDVSGYASGMYIIRLVNGENKEVLYTTKIIKAK